MIRLSAVLGVSAALFLNAASVWAGDQKQVPKVDPNKLFEKLDANKDGKISKEEFKKITELGQGKLKDRAELLDKVFARLDANGDGSLSPEEFGKFGAAVKRFAAGAEQAPGGLLAAAKDPEATFKRLDADKDGKLSKDEFKKLIEEAKLPKLKERQDQIFTRLDADGNGSLSLGEFKKLGELAQKLGQKIKKGDKK